MITTGTVSLSHRNIPFSSLSDCLHWLVWISWNVFISLHWRITLSKSVSNCVVLGHCLLLEVSERMVILAPSPHGHQHLRVFIRCRSAIRQVLLGFEPYCACFSSLSEANLKLTSDWCKKSPRWLLQYKRPSSLSETPEDCHSVASVHVTTDGSG